MTIRMLRRYTQNASAAQLPILPNCPNVRAGLGTTTIKRQLIMGKVSVEPQPEVLRRQAMLASGKRMEKKTSAKLALLRALRAGSLM